MKDYQDIFWTRNSWQTQHTPWQIIYKINNNYYKLKNITRYIKQKSIFFYLQIVYKYILQEW